MQSEDLYEYVIRLCIVHLCDMQCVLTTKV